MAAFRVYADVHLRELGRPAVAALAADEAGEHLAVPPQRGHRRLRRGLRPDPHLGIDQVPELQELHVIVDRLLVFQRALDPRAGGELRDRLGCLEVEGVAPLAEPGEENPVPGLCLFEGGDEHQERMGRPRLPAHLVHRVDNLIGHLLGRCTQLLGDRLVLRLEEAGEDDPLHVVHRDPDLLEKAAHRLGDELRIPLLAEPALLPHVVVGLSRTPIVVDEVVGDRVGPLELGDDVPIPDEEGGGAVAEPHLVEVGGFRLPFIGCRHEDVRPASPRDDVEGGDEPRRPRAERRGEIGGDHRVPEVQRRLEDPGVLAVGEGERRRAEVAPVDQPFVRSDQAVARGGDRHRERVLVVVAHRALPLGDHDDGRGEPAHRLEDRRPLEPQAGNVGAVGSDSDHLSSLLLFIHEAAYTVCHTGESRYRRMSRRSVQVH